MAVSLKASNRGLEVVDAARRERGWTKASMEWCKAAQVALASLKRFWLGRPIKQETFVAICQAVGIDWREVADLEKIAELEEREPKELIMASPPVEIDWRKLAFEMFAANKRLTTNSITVGDGLTFDLDEIYVPLGLGERQQRARRGGSVSPERGSQLYEPDTQEVSRLFQHNEFFEQVLKLGNSPKSRGRRLAIIGEPGSGKTTLLQKIADWVFKDTENDIAIWVSLADLQGKSLEAYLLEDWLKTATRRVYVTEAMQEALAEQFNRGHVWLLLDGLDEIVMDVDSASPTGAIASQLIGWIAQARVVLTCRLNVWDTTKNALTNFDVYRNSDFSYGDSQAPDQVNQFISRWFINSPELGNRLRAELNKPERKLIKDLVKNPLRLALLCCIWARRQGGLPSTKAALYEQFVTTLYEWKQERFPTDTATRQELNKALGKLALQALAEEKTNFRLRHSLVFKVLGVPDAPQFQLALQIGWLNQVGVAAENPDEPVYAFFHPSFQEYFAAQAIPESQYFLEEDTYYLMFEVQWEELIFQWLAPENLPKQQKAGLTRTLIDRMWKSQDEDTRWRIAQTLEVIGADSPDTVKAMTDLLHTTQDDYTRCQAATSLGRIAPGNSDAIKALIELLNSTQDELLRQQAVESLEQIGAGNSDAINAITNLLHASKDEWTRQEATKSLFKQLGVINPNATQFLKNLLLNFQQLHLQNRQSLDVSESGVFTAGNTGQVSLDYVLDGGKYQGELAIFSLDGMDNFELGSEAFIQEVARRALSNSELGYVVINEPTNGTRFQSSLPWESDYSSGDYKAVKTFAMCPGDNFGVMLVPNGTVQSVFNNPTVEGTIRPLFSLSTANSNEAFPVGQIADVTGDGITFVMKDLRMESESDKDYNNIIFKVRGATGKAVQLNKMIDPDKDWRSTDLGKALSTHTITDVNSVKPISVSFDFPMSAPPLVGVIDTGFRANNPDINYSSINLGRKPISDNASSLLPDGEGNEHNIHVLGIIAATRNNDIDIDWVNNKVPIWCDRAVGSRQWADSLVEFVNVAKESGQPNAIANLNFDLTQVNPDGSVTTRYEFTPQERTALEYARQNKVLIVMAAGNDSDVISVLAQASQEFDNIITVDVEQNAATKVTGTASSIWAANPDLSYRQVIDILQGKATDLNTTTWDRQAGAGQLDIAAAVHLTQTTTIPPHGARAFSQRESDRVSTVKGATQALNELLLKVKQHPPKSKERKMAFTKLINVVMEADEFSSKGQFPPEIYNDALKKVFLEIKRQIDNSDLTQIDALTWINFLLNQQMETQLIESENDKQLQQSEWLKPLIINAANRLTFSTEIRQCLEKASEELCSKHLPGHPDANFQILVNLREAGESWKELSDFWKIPVSQLITFYQRCIKHLNPKLTDYLQSDCAIN